MHRRGRRDALELGCLDTFQTLDPTFWFRVSRTNVGEAQIPKSVYSSGGAVVSFFEHSFSTPPVKTWLGVFANPF